MEDDGWLLESIEKKTGMDREKVLFLVEKKMNEFPSLTKNAAERMIATEMGVLPIRREYKIKDIAEEIKHINLTAIMKRKFEPRTVIVHGRNAKVLRINIEDDTGSIGITIWDENIINKIINESAEGDEISIANAYSRVNKFNNEIELNLGNGSAIAIKKKVDNKPVDSFVAIKDVKDSEKLYRLRGFITRLFSNNVYLVRCDICKKKVDRVCDLHGDKAISKILMISGILDDGLSSIRVSFFDRSARKLLDMSREEDTIRKINDISYGLIHVEITGSANKFNDNLSINAKDIKPFVYAL